VKRIPMISGDEYDYLTPARRSLAPHRDLTRTVKRSYRRRERHSARHALRIMDLANA
jgi:hypothetical protein